MLFFRCEVECGVGEFEGGDSLQHLLAEVGSGVDDNAHVTDLDHRRGTQAFVALVRRAAHLTSATDERHSLRCSRSQKC